MVRTCYLRTAVSSLKRTDTIRPFVFQLKVYFPPSIRHLYLREVSGTCPGIIIRSSPSMISMSGRSILPRDVLAVGVVSGAGGGGGSLPPAPCHAATPPVACTGRTWPVFSRWYHFLRSPFCCAGSQSTVIFRLANVVTSTLLRGAREGRARLFPGCNEEEDISFLVLRVHLRVRGPRSVETVFVFKIRTCFSFDTLFVFEHLFAGFYVTSTVSVAPADGASPTDNLHILVIERRFGGADFDHPHMTVFSREYLLNYSHFPLIWGE